MAEIQWIKLSTDLFSNRKIKQLERCDDGAEITLIWIKLLCLAGLVNARGQVYIADDIPYTAELLAAEVGCADEVATRALELFARFDMAKINDAGHIYICDWERHQNSEALDKMRQKHREAQARYYRKQKQKSALTSALTSDDASKEKEKEKEKDKENEESRCAAGASEGESPAFADEQPDEPTAAAQKSARLLSADECRAEVSESTRIPTNAETSSAASESVYLPSTAETFSPAGYTPEFEKFWKTYPVKTAKRKCFEIWQTKKLGEKAEQIIAAVETQRKTAPWQKENGRYIPNPQTYLTGDRWEDTEPYREVDRNTAWIRRSAIYSQLAEG